MSQEGQPFWGYKGNLKKKRKRKIWPNCKTIFIAINHLTFMDILAIMAIMNITDCHIMAVNMAKLYVYWKSISNADGLWREYLDFFSL